MLKNNFSEGVRNERLFLVHYYCLHNTFKLFYHNNVRYIEVYMIKKILTILSGGCTIKSQSKRRVLHGED